MIVAYVCMHLYNHSLFVGFLVVYGFSRLEVGETGPGGAADIKDDSDIRCIQVDTCDLDSSLRWLIQL